MSKKNANYNYPEGRKEEAFKVVDKFFINNTSNDYLDNLKSMIDDQINATKTPEFIGQTLFDFINYDLERKTIDISNNVLVSFKRKLTNVLGGKKQ